uniref:COesterase domain-containing protein n=1 Tax=Steinernema glaseri TaxID=37863 RepID=A0A1I8AF36_9BILA
DPKIELDPKTLFGDIGMCIPTASPNKFLSLQRFQLRPTIPHGAWSRSTAIALSFSSKILRRCYTRSTNSTISPTT